MKTFNNFVKNMEIIIFFPIQELLNIMAKYVNTTCFLQNNLYIRPILKNTPYELWKGRQPNISYFHPFRCDSFILNNKDNLGKFEPNLIREDSLDTQQRSKHIKSITYGL
ncbi:hypothetical protein CR513_11830, partial [Mucuna pruriens]